jgi:hypothetical protein
MGEGAGLFLVTQMPNADPRKRLREIRDEEERVEALRPERDRLIRQATTEQVSQRTLAKETGLSKSRIGQIASVPLDE